jgi:hypothetical protein
MVSSLLWELRSGIENQGHIVGPSEGLFHMVIGMEAARHVCADNAAAEVIEFSWHISSGRK